MAIKSELEARIIELEQKNNILLSMIKSIRSDTTDVDLVTFIQDLTIIFDLYGTFLVRQKGEKEFTKLNTFEALLAFVETKVQKR